MTHSYQQSPGGSTPDTQPLISRRGMLMGSGGVAAGAGMALLAGCGSGDQSPQSNGNPGDLVLPEHIESDAVTADLPANDDGVLAGYFSYPGERPSVVPETPGDGSTISGFAKIFYAAPPTVSSNSYWAGLNERLGVTLEMEMVPNADYAQKIATVVAGGNLPDLVQLDPDLVPNIPGVLSSLFEPLDEYLAGDAIEEYPNLAALDSDAWRGTSFNNSIYGIPQHRGRIQNYNFVRADIFEAHGVPVDPKGWSEFVEVCEELTNPGSRQWALGQVGRALTFARAVNGTPNGWADDGSGNLVHMYETEEFRQSVSDVTDLWNRGVIHPDGLSGTQPFKELFNSGTVAITPADGYVAWAQYVSNNASNPEFKMALMPTYNREGTELAPWPTGPGIYKAFAGIRKQDDPERVKMILRVLNWLAAPFGSSEYLYRIYGEEGVDHTISDTGDPELTTQGQANTVVPVRFLADSISVLYQPGRPEDVEVQHAYQEQVLASTNDDASANLYSPTASQKGGSAGRTFDDVVNQIVAGRRPLDDLTAAVDAWRAEVGDAARQEYQEAREQMG